MLVDISPTSSYYVSRDASITWAGAPSSYLRAYNLLVSATNETKTETKKIVIDIASLMLGMANPVLVVYHGYKHQTLDVDGEIARTQLLVYDGNDNLISEGCYNGLHWDNGGPYELRFCSVISANMASHKTLETKIALYCHVVGKKASALDCYCRVLGYVGLYDAKS